jgi:hypothetical protein
MMAHKVPKWYSTYIHVIGGRKLSICIIQKTLGETYLANNRA